MCSTEHKFNTLPGRPLIMSPSTRIEFGLHGRKCGQTVARIEKDAVHTPGAAARAAGTATSSKMVIRGEAVITRKLSSLRVILHHAQSAKGQCIERGRDMQSREVRCERARDWCAWMRPPEPRSDPHNHRAHAQASSSSCAWDGAPMEHSWPDLVPPRCTGEHVHPYVHRCAG